MKLQGPEEGSKGTKKKDGDWLIRQHYRWDGLSNRRRKKCAKRRAMSKKEIFKLGTRLFFIIFVLYSFVRTSLCRLFNFIFCLRSSPRPDFFLTLFEVDLLYFRFFFLSGTSPTHQCMLLFKLVSIKVPFRSRFDSVRLAKC